MAANRQNVDMSRVYDALRKADAAGNTEDAQKLAQYIRSVQSPSQTQAQTSQTTSDSNQAPQRQQPNLSLDSVYNAPELNELSGKAFKVGLGSLMTSDPDRLKKLFKSHYPNAKFTQDTAGDYQVHLPSGTYQLARKGKFEPQDLARTVFQASLFGFNPFEGLLSGTGLDVAIQAGQEEGVKHLGGGDVNKTNLALAGAVRPIASAFGSLGNVVPKTRQENIQDILKTAEKHGIDLSTSNLFPPSSKIGQYLQQFGKDLPFGGTGDLAATQQAQRTSATEKYLQQYNEDHKGVVDSIIRQKDKVISKAGEDRDAVIDRLGDTPLKIKQKRLGETGEPQFEHTRTFRNIDNAIHQISTSDGKPIEVSNTEQSAIDVLQRYKRNLERVNSFRGLTDIRTRLRNELEPFEKQVGTKQQGAIKQIYSSMTKDMDDIVRQNSSIQEFNQWKEANHTFFEEGDKVRNSKIKNLLNANKRVEGSVSPEEVSKGLLYGDTVARQQLFDSLDEKGREAARSTIMANIGEKSLVNDQISPNKFLRQLTNNQDKFKMYFKGEDGEALNGLRKALILTKSAQDEFVTPKNGAKTISYIMGAIFGASPVGALKSAAIGSAFKTYEGKSMRNILIKLSKTNRNSPAFKRTAKTFFRILANISKAAVTN